MIFAERWGEGGDRQEVPGPCRRALENVRRSLQRRRYQVRSEDIFCSCLYVEIITRPGWAGPGILIPSLWQRSRVKEPSDGCEEASSFQQEPPLPL